MKFEITIRDRGNAWWVYMRVGVQSFPVGFGSETKEHAEWYAKMLERALTNITNENPSAT